MFARVARWVSFAEYLQEQLTGSRGVSLSMASGTGLLDIHTLQWYQPALDAAGITPDQLGTLTPLKDNSTSTQRWPGLERVPWLPAVGDGACSNLGAGCASPDRFALMISTSGAERAVWSPPAEFSVPWGLWSYRIDDQRVEVLVRQFLDRGERLKRNFHGKFQLAEDLRHNLRSFLIWAEKQRLVAHDGMVGTLVCSGKLLM